MEDEVGLLTAFNSESSEPDLMGACVPLVAEEVGRGGSCFVAVGVAENTSPPKNESEANPFPETTLESLAMG
jgi:hypothetical protein